MIGAVAGGILGQIIPFDMTGIDFCMTALFVIIFIDQWEKAESHIPAIAGIVIAAVCMLVVGPQYFLLPSQRCLWCGIRDANKSQIKLKQYDLRSVGRTGKKHEYKIYIDRNCSVSGSNICTEGTSICHI